MRLGPDRADDQHPDGDTVEDDVGEHGSPDPRGCDDQAGAHDPHESEGCYRPPGVGIKDEV